MQSQQSREFHLLLVDEDVAVASVAAKSDALVPADYLGLVHEPGAQRLRVLRPDDGVRPDVEIVRAREQIKAALGGAGGGQCAHHQHQGPKTHFVVKWEIRRRFLPFAFYIEGEFAFAALLFGRQSSLGWGRSILNARTRHQRRAPSRRGEQTHKAKREAKI